jgi:hypothetical protein
MQAIALPNYLAGYPPELVAQVRRLIEQDLLGDWLLQKYPGADYHQLEFDLRTYLNYLSVTGNRLWGTGQDIDETRAAL